MRRLKIASLKYAFPYLIIFIACLFEGLLHSKSYIENLDICEDLIMGIIIFLIGVVGVSAILLSIVTGKCQRAVYNCIKDSSTPLLEKERIEDFLAKAPYVYNLQYNKNYICSKKEFFTVFVRTQDVVKVYKKTRMHRYMKIVPIFKICELAIVTFDGRVYTIDFLREKHMNEAMMILKGICKQASIEI